MEPDTTQDAPEGAEGREPAQTENARQSAADAAVEASERLLDDPHGGGWDDVAECAMQRRVAQRRREDQMGSCADCRAHDRAGNATTHPEHAAAYEAAHRALGRAERALDAACDKLLDG